MMFDTLMFVRKAVEQMCGQRAKGIQCVALTDNQGLFSNIHHLKSNVDDYRLQADILELRKNIEQEKIVQEVRYVQSASNIADALTKTTKTGEMLLQLVQTGRYDLPGGTQIRDSTMTSVRTWNELIQKEQSMKHEEGEDKIDHFISLNLVQEQPQLEEGKQSSLPPLSSPSRRRSYHTIEAFAPATNQSLSHPEESTPPERASSDPGDPKSDEYHRSRDKTNGIKTMSEKSKSKYEDTIVKPSAPNQLSSQ